MQFSQDSPGKSYSGATSGAAAFAAALLIILTLFRVFISVPRGSGLTHESGVLTGLAMDYRNGLFYRPLLSPHGYGGTRYGPLHIVLQGTLMDWGLGPIPSGHLISLTAALALFLGAYGLLRQSRVSRSLSLCFASLEFAGLAGQYAVTSIRLDLLAAAMNMGGLLCVASLCRDIPQTQRNRRGNYLLCIAAASLFALAVLTKITDLFGVVASVLFLLRIRQILPATLLCAITALFAIAGFLCFNLLSHGQMLENFHACANAGRSVLSIRHWFSILHEVYLQDDWIGTLLMATALLAWLISTVNEKLSLPGLFLIVAISMTVPMYFSPGLSINHLLDAEAASAIYLGFHLSRVPNSTRWWIATTALFLCSIFRFSQPRYLKECFYHRTDAFRSAVLSADPTGGPVLSDHALVPVTVGQSPFLLDDYTFPSVRASHPDAQDDLYHRLDTAYFGAVVLRYDPSKGDRPAVFGKNFQTVLLRRYQLLSQTNFWDHLWIYGRRNDPPPAP